MDTNQLLQCFQHQEQEIARLQEIVHQLRSVTPTTPHQLYARPTPFSGKENVRNWLLQVKAFVCAVYPNANNDNVAMVIITNLTGSALTWSRIYMNDDAQLTVTSEKFIKLFVNQFTPFSDEKQAEADLDRLKQTTSVVKYIEHFDEITLRIDKMADDEKRRCFIRGLKPHIRAEVDKTNSTTLDAVRKVALVHDTNYSRQFFPQSAPNIFPRQVAYPRPFATPYEPMDIDAFQFRRPAPLSEQNRLNLRATGSCFRCRRPGHIIKNCPLNRTTANNRPNKPVARINNLEYGYPSMMYPYVPMYPPMVPALYDSQISRQQASLQNDPSSSVPLADNTPDFQDCH